MRKFKDYVKENLDEEVQENYDSIAEFSDDVSDEGLEYVLMNSINNKGLTYYNFEDKELIGLCNEFIKITQLIYSKIK